MFQIKLSRHNLRSALLLGAASSAAIALTLPALAQEQSVETVVVTGSRIPQTGLYASSPVTAVGQQELKLEGTTSVETLLNNLPGVFAEFGQDVSNGSTGTATVNLRGLGSQRTLVLVNGTRLMPGDPSLPVADLNQIPAALVDHVEVLTGGASAVYGSDAEAGVVNFVMRKDFEGVEVDGQYTINQAGNNGTRNGVSYSTLDATAGFASAPKDWWGGDSRDATLILGTNTADGKGNVTAYVGYRNSQPVLEAKRDFSACSLTTDFTTNLHCAGSSNYNRFISLDDAYAGINYDFFEQGNGTRGSGTFVPYHNPDGSTPTDHTFNYGALNYLQRPDERYEGGYFAHYQINKAIDVYSTFMFSDDHTLAQIAPSGLFLGTGRISGAFVNINCANPLITGNEAADLCGNNAQAGLGNPCTPIGNTGNCNLTPGQALLEIGRRDLEGGNRVDDLRHTAYRMNVGVRGDLGSGWSYDVYGQYGLTLLSETYDNEFSVGRVQNALEVDPATGKCFSAEPDANGFTADPTCVPLDIFNGFGAITPAQLNYVKAQGFKEGLTQEQIVSGAMTGDLGAWGFQSPWAKSPVAVSFGGEYRQEMLELKTSRDFQINDLYGQGGASLPVPLSGFDVAEGFGEVRIPLVQGMPFFQDLSINGGYRYSDYNTSGGVSSYKIGAEWQPIDDFRVRSSYQRAVRAPNVLELFTPLNSVLFGGNDPCLTQTTGQCATVKNAGKGILDCPASQCNQQTGGNINVNPETSITKSVGIVFTPTFFDGFNATIDFFDIKVNHFIGTVDPNVTLAECYGPGATAATIAFFCPLVNRNQFGQLYAGGFVSAQTTNTGFLSTRGLDFEANYQVDLADWSMSGYGSLGFNFVGTWLDTLKTNPLPGIGTFDCSGLFGVVCGTPNPVWRHKLRATWVSPWDMDLSLQWRHLSSVKLDANTSDPLLNGVCGAPCADIPDNRISDFDYFDLSGNWTVRQGVEIRAGVDNLFDKNPPTVDSNALSIAGAPFGNGNTYPGTYDSLGRTIFVGVTLKY